MIFDANSLKVCEGSGTTVVVDGEPILKPIAWGMLLYQSVMIGAAYVVTFATRPWKVI